MAKMYSCGVPEIECVAGNVTFSGPITKKLHGSRDEARKCMIRHLKSQGYEQLGPREFKNPENGYIRVLTKKTRYGQVVYYTKEKTRFMRPRGKSGHIAGI